MIDINEYDHIRKRCVELSLMFKKVKRNLAWWLTSAILSYKRLGQENYYKIEVSLINTEFNANQVSKTTSNHSGKTVGTKSPS